MPIPVSLLRVALAACAAFTLLSASAAAAAKPESVPANLRVVNAQGKTLADAVQYTGTTRVKTSRHANCFGPGTGGSGDRVTVPGPTALGILQDAAFPLPSLRPLAVSDHFDFGLALCGIGGYQAPQTGYWYLKRNHAGSTTGGDQTVLERGDDVLWYLIRDYTDPIPAELALKAPAAAQPGEPFGVKVVAYADDGTKAPAAGAAVGGEITDGSGMATITPSGEGVLPLKATRGADIPSGRVDVCVRADSSRCPSRPLRKINGSNHADAIDGTRGPDVISALGGGDVIDIRGRDRPDAASANRGSVAFDVVKCGVGEDTLIAWRGQRFRARNSCEEIDLRGATPAR